MDTAVTSVVLRSGGSGRPFVRRCAASASAVLLGAAVLALVPAAGPAAAQTPATACAATTASTDYDTDDDRLIEVCSLAQLDAMRWDLNGDGTADVYSDGNHDAGGAAGYAAAFPNAAAGMGCPSAGCEGYELAVDLDFDTNSSGAADAGDTYWNGGKGWRPIGKACPYAHQRCPDAQFSAVFDGNGLTIANLHIVGDGDATGLFEAVQAGGTIRDVGLTAPDFGSVSGSFNVGSLVGLLEGGRVSGVWAEVDVSGELTVGGLVGTAKQGSVVVGSWASGDVSARTSEAGGLVGLTARANVAASYATGDVTCGIVSCGGLVGFRIIGGVTASYATGDVTCGAGDCGGLIGWMARHGELGEPAQAAYSTGRVTLGGVSGLHPHEISDLILFERVVARGDGERFSGGSVAGLIGYCGFSPGHEPRMSYWDTEASGVAADECATGYTTAQLQSPTGYTGIYADWNVDVDGDGSADDPWDFGTTSQYPVLKWGSLDAAAQRAVGMGSPPAVVPELSITGGGGVTEGETASFTITASPVPVSPLTVSLALLEAGDWGASGPVVVTVSGASTLLSVSTVDDDVDEADGSVTVFLSDGSGYTVSSSAGSATVAVADDDDAPVEQGEQQQGQQDSQQQDPPPGYAVDAAVVAKVRALAGQTQHGTVHVNRWNRVLVAFGEHDGTGVTDGPMTAAQAQGMADRHSSPVWGEVVTELTNLEASTADTEDDDVSLPTPVVSVAAGSAISEGGTASFTVTADPAPATPITVKVGVSESGSFGASGAATVQVSSATTTYTVTTVDDQADEADGSVTVTLQDGSGYTVSSTAGAATVDVADDDVPEVSITAGSAITEGGAATFTVSATPVPASPITVKVAVSQNGSFGATGAATVTLSGASTAYTVTTVDDQVDEADGSVTVTLQDGSGYVVSSTAGAATVSVADNDDAPPQDGQQDQQQQDQQPEYVVDAGVAAKVRALAGQTQHGTAHVNRWSRVLVAFGVHDGTGVTDGPMTAAQAQQMADRHSSPVWDEVVTELANLEAANTATEDDDDPPPTPVLSITAGSAVTEGGTASFTITASPAPATALTVKVGVSESGSYGASGAATVTLSGASTTYTVATTDDGVDEFDGSVTVTLQGGDGYTVSSTGGAATVSVADDDVPVVSISAGSGVTEGGTATFTVSASPAPAGPIAVKVAVVESGSFGAVGAVTVTVSGASATYTVTTVDDEADEADGSVTVTLQGGSGYTVSATQGAATVSVADDDDPLAQDPPTEQDQQDTPADQGQTPEDPPTEQDQDAPAADGPIAMSVSDASAVEGEDLVFAITLSRAADAPIAVVYVTLVGTASSADYAFGNDIVTIAAGETEFTVRIATTADSVAEGAERMYFQLAGAFGGADVDIADGDAVGTISDN